MLELAPGYILQRMYLKRRLKSLFPAIDGRVSFCEVGTGKGANSNIFLQSGFKGVGFELNPAACRINEASNRCFIDAGKYQVLNDDFLSFAGEEKFDVVFSSMVIEHLSEKQVSDYFDKCIEVLKPNGVIITLVPANMKYWGIEDEIAGHFKRYEYECFEKIANDKLFSIVKTTGLTFPISNWLLSLSNIIVSSAEADKTEMTLQERTELSGNRDVMFKTVYPRWFSFFLNDFTMLPFFALQSINYKNRKSMVLYNEYKIK